MAYTTYVYNKQVNPSLLKTEIENNPIITIGVNNVQINGANSVVSAIMKDALNTTQENALSAVVSGHIYKAPTAELIYDKEGKLVVHQSVRPTGTYTYFTGAGDDPSILSDVGNGTHAHIIHLSGETLSGETYIDFNIVNNKTYIYEGYISWDGPKMVELDVSVVPIVTSWTAATGTNYDLYGGYLIIPSMNGSIQLTSDITMPSGGLVYMPLHNDGTRTPAYWDATWNSTTERYENITANPLGEGEYNMFGVEVPLTRFVNNYNITGRGTQELDSEDTEELGHGMRFKFAWSQHENVPDTDWQVGVTFAMHREKTT